MRLTESFTSSAPKSSYIFSRLPYLRSSSSAVFSPTPGTPGMLSEASPISAFKSTMRAGSKPYSDSKRARS